MTYPIKCLQCHAERTSPIVCDGCHALYPIPQTINNFDLMGMPRTFDIDERSLTAAYRAIARRVHPDRFGGDTEEVRTLATRLSAEINRAYGVLRDPLKRAEYLLELSGGPSAAELREVPGPVLAEVMTLREEIEPAKAGGDATLLNTLRNTIEERRRAMLAEVRRRAEHVGESSPEERAKFRRLLNAMKYFDNLMAELALDPLAADTGGST
ncbi:MAG: Fe-S protein assembly co-chaperone HscB [Planctomycetota bacterium]